MGFDLTGSVQKLVVGVDKLSKTLNSIADSDAPTASTAPAASAAPEAPQVKGKGSMNKYEFLLALQEREEKRKNSDEGTVFLYFILGGCVSLYSILMGVVFGTFSSLMIGIGGAIFGVAVVVKGIQKKSLMGLNKKYAVLIANNPDATIHNLAASLEENPDEVKENINLFIKKGLLTNVVIDGQSGRLIYGPADSLQLGPDGTLQVEKAEMVEVECLGCGAKKLIKQGGASTCDHCGNSLHA